MGAKKLNLENKVVFSNENFEHEKLSIREVWKKLWHNAKASLIGALSLAHNLLFGARIVREIAPGSYEELDVKREASANQLIF